ncbi:MAG: ABC transporter permease [Candidatus Marinimicrobia bacterium]|nr:ABC transporter permease [Candidatus Neomarinimicrobiota bacterium]MCF7828517.1 ABC transporter permease [Candidatus Neomarinimicrobiota bacterium]MCF7882060.1 ABC transporter permease [Candidatus Neomarinimicrobiota bacterium]
MFKIAFRNIFRQKRRTILTMLTMFGGFVLSAFSIGYADGTYSYIIDLFTRNQMGHVQIHQGNYLDRPSLYKTIEDYVNVGDTVQAVDRVQEWAPRLYSSGLASVGDKTAGVRAIGVDPQLEHAATDFRDKVKQGRYLSDEPSHEVMLGTGLADILNAEVGDTTVIVSQGADGSIANDLYHVVGIVDRGDQMENRTGYFLHLKDAQELFVLPNQVHEIIVVANSIHGVREIARTIDGALNNENLQVKPWMEIARTFYKTMMADQQGMWIMLFVIILIVAIGVLNTVLMSVLERTREYGVLKAMGTRPNEVFRMVLYEVSIMAVFSVILGALLAIGLNSYFSIHGIPLPTPLDWGGIQINWMYTENSLRSITLPTITVIITALIVSVFPAIKAARIAPAQAMRMH